MATIARQMERRFFRKTLVGAQRHDVNTAPPSSSLVLFACDLFKVNTAFPASTVFIVVKNKVTAK